MTNRGYPNNPGGGYNNQQPMAGAPQQQYPPQNQYPPQGPGPQQGQMPGGQQQPFNQGGRGPVSPVSRVPLERTFQVNYFSESEGRQYDGTFVVRRPNIRQQARITARHSEILGGFYYDPDNPGFGVPVDMDILAEMMAFLDMTVIEGPEWFQSDDMFDPGLIYAIYGEAVKVDPFRVAGSAARQAHGVRESGATENAGPPTGLGGSESDPQRDAPGHNDSIEAMVDTSVQTPNDE